MMPTPAELAQQYATQTATAVDLEALARELLEALGTLDGARHWDVGAGGRIVVALPGWNPHRPARDFLIESWPG
jgi:hypothetical protein